MIKNFLPLLGAFLLISCGQSKRLNDYTVKSEPQKYCIWSYNSDTETIGTFFDTNVRVVPKIQYISPVSLESAQDSIDTHGYCDGNELDHDGTPLRP